MAPSDHAWVKLAVLTSPHGVKGHVKARSFATPGTSLADYTEMTDAAGNAVALRVVGGTVEAPIVAIDGVQSREEAERWRNKEIGVARGALKDITKPDTHYVADLVGITVVDQKGAALGTVANVMNFGAGDILEIAFTGGGTELFAFTKATFPIIDKTARRITMIPPEVLGARAEEGVDEV